VLPEDEEPNIPPIPFERRDALGKRKPSTRAPAAKHGKPKKLARAPREVVKTALTVEARKGKLYVFLPPTDLLEDFISLISVVEATAQALRCRCASKATRRRTTRASPLRGDAGPGRDRGEHPPSEDWDELKHRVETMYEEARLRASAPTSSCSTGATTGTGGGIPRDARRPTAATARCCGAPTC
jgi:uncharacterized protein (DUF2126 family)